MAAQPISSARRPGAPATGCLVVFFSVFALAGALGFWATTVRPLLAIVSALSWREASCVVLTSQVAESAGSRSTTYKVDILYSYSVDGRSYQSNRYRFGDFFSSGREGKEEIVARFPPGTRTACWVDPADPAKAVIDRGFSPVYFAGLFPLLFFAVGAGGITWVLHSARKKDTPAGPQVDPVAAFGVSAPAGDGSGPLELRPVATPLGKFAGITLVTLFWDGIVSVFVVQIYNARQDGIAANGFSVLFLIPFVLVGLLLIYATFRQLLILFNPRVHLTVNPGTLPLGGTGFLEWRLSGRGGGVRRLRILLEGREEAWFRSGKNTQTVRNVFASVAVADTTSEAEIPAGSARIEVPGNTVPSFKATHNKIIWSLKVTCEIAGWPDSDDEYEVLVRPGRAEGGWA
jgi:hypothetical protein